MLTSGRSGKDGYGVSTPPSPSSLYQICNNLSIKASVTTVSALRQKGRDVHWPRRVLPLMSQFEYTPPWDRQTDRQKRLPLQTQPGTGNN